MPFVTVEEANLIDEAHPSASTVETVSLDWQTGQQEAGGCWCPRSRRHYCGGQWWQYGG